MKEEWIDHQIAIQSLAYARGMLEGVRLAKERSHDVARILAEQKEQQALDTLKHLTGAKG